MYGTMRGTLPAREIKVNPDTYKANIEGRIEGTGRTIFITEIAIHYDLTIPVGMRVEADRALEVHPSGWPAHESVKDAIKITWTADVKEEG